MRSPGDLPLTLSCRWQQVLLSHTSSWDRYPPALMLSPPQPYRCYSSVPGCSPPLHHFPHTSPCKRDKGYYWRRKSSSVIPEQRKISINVKFLVCLHSNKYPSPQSCSSNLLSTLTINSHQFKQVISLTGKDKHTHPNSEISLKTMTEHCQIEALFRGWVPFVCLF